MPSNARKNATTSSIASDPTTRATVRRNVCTATLATFRYARVGIIIMRKMRLSRSRSDRRGASRKSSACRVGGVSIDDQVEVARVVELVQLLHRHVFLGAAERTRDVAVEAVVEDALRLLGRHRVAGDEPVERRLGVEHERRRARRRVWRCRRRPSGRVRSCSACRTGSRARACRPGAWPGRS